MRTKKNTRNHQKAQDSDATKYQSAFVQTSISGSLSFGRQIKESETYDRKLLLKARPISLAWL